jgi:hypothetical protein
MRISAGSKMRGATPLKLFASLQISPFTKAVAKDPFERDMDRQYLIEGMRQSGLPG